MLDPDGGAATHWLCHMARTRTGYTEICPGFGHPANWDHIIRYILLVAGMIWFYDWCARAGRGEHEEGES